MVIASPIDVHWTGRVRSIAACLLEADGQAVLLDPGPTSSLETLRAKLAKRGMTFGSLSAVLLTHIHLDHAGAVGSIVHENPRLPVFVHERGAPHMADPSKLLASAGRLYGNLLQSLYGDVRPVPQENLRVLQGGEKVPVGRQSLEVVYTPG
ncbi:MAG TPA: MBL fold metallo-hydrolase, partial [Methylomirabilota bacterium]|nr:MBL fold metallo-hydrolase [Methylomirabilota bacterium]